MKRLTWILRVAILFTAAAVAPVAGNCAPNKSSLFVQVKESKLRSQPQFWAPAVADISYGTELTALGADSANKSWIKAKLGSTEGFVHVSAITNKKVILSAAGSSGSAAKADSSDVVLAGKGFNKQVENSYKSSKGLDFGAVDLVEKNKVDGAEELTFLEEGHLIH